MYLTTKVLLIVRHDMHSAGFDIAYAWHMTVCAVLATEKA